MRVHKGKQMNLNDFQVNGLNPSIVGGTGNTAVKYFPRRQFMAGSTFNTQSNAPSASNAYGQLVVPGLNELNGQLFSAAAAGTIGNDTGDPSGTFDVTIYANTGSVTSPNYVVMATTGIFAPVVPGTQSWAIKMTLEGDSASGLCGGSYSAYVNGVAQGTPPTATAVLSGINFGAAIPFGLVVGVKFGTSDASNTASLYQFTIGSEF